MRKSLEMQKLERSGKYLAYGLLSNAALFVYYHAPRAILQDEAINLHRWAMKRAHTHRTVGEALSKQTQD